MEYFVYKIVEENKRAMEINLATMEKINQILSKYNEDDNNDKNDNGEENEGNI